MEHDVVPKSIGIIMDGNRRWAKAKGKPSLFGHEKGYETFVSAVEWAGMCGVEHIYFYAFSTENWNRSEEEVSGLMSLFLKGFSLYGEKAVEENIRVRFAGSRDQLTEDIQAAMNDIEAKSSSCTGITVVICLSYGGHKEIVDATNALIREGVREIDEAMLQERLSTHPTPHPDMIIRTGGEQRLSNFLTWQSAYSELFFSDTLWPDFSKEEFEDMLKAYGKRKRRWGR